jgi:dTDP-4-amino-4,6-dideoxygalactose transaminase
MEPVLQLAKDYGLFVIEDNAQAIGAEYTFSNGHKAKTGTMGDIGCTSFFPSKNLGCYGDGGALCTNDDALAERIRMIANHGQKKKYYHSVIGCNSRLDTIQAAILNVKLPHLDEYGKARNEAAAYYTRNLKDVKGIDVPYEAEYSTHVYHQYTLKVQDGKRDALKKYLEDNNIPAMIYYPLPLQEQEAFQHITRTAESLEISKNLAESVLSLPMHTELDKETQDYIISKVSSFFGK